MEDLVVRAGIYRQGFLDLCLKKLSDTDIDLLVIQIGLEGSVR